MVKKLIFRLKDLPVLVEVLGDNQEKKLYQLAPAGRKVGASLQKVPKSFLGIRIR